MMNYYYYPNHMFFGGFGFFSLLWDIVIIWAIFALLGKIFGHHSSNVETKSEALDILKKRYAHGDITKKEFDSMKKDIE